MKKLIIHLLFFCCLFSNSYAQNMRAFTPGNFVVLFSNQPASTTAVTLREYTPAGNLVQSKDLSTLTTPNNPCYIATNSASETEYGYMSRSANGQFATFGAYGQASTTGNRIGAMLKYDGTINTQTTFTGSSYQFLTPSATSSNSTSLTLSGNPNYSASATGTATSIATGFLSTINLTASNAGFANGNYIYGPNIPANTTITAGGGTSTLTISAPATATNGAVTYYSSASLYKITGGGITAGTTITAFNSTTNVATLSQAATVTSTSTPLTVELTSPTSNFPLKSVVTTDGTGLWMSYSGSSSTPSGILYQTINGTGTPTNILASIKNSTLRQMNISGLDNNLYISKLNNPYYYFTGVPTTTQTAMNQPPNATSGTSTSNRNMGYCFVQPLSGGGEVMYVANTASNSLSGTVTASSTSITFTTAPATTINGNYISGPGIPNGTTISGANGSATTLTLSQAASSTQSGNTYYWSPSTSAGIYKYYRTSAGAAWTAAGSFGTSANNYLTVTAQPKPSGGFTLYATKYDYNGNGVNVTPVSGTTVIDGLPVVVKIVDAASYNVTMSGTESVIATGAMGRDVFKGISVVPTVATNMSVFYYNGTGNVDNVASWTSNYDGSAGTSPANFTANNQVFILKNALTINSFSGSTWAVSGTNSTILVGDGYNTVNFDTTGVTVTIGGASIGALNVNYNSFLTGGTYGGTPLSIKTPLTPQSHVQNVFSDAYATQIPVSNWAASANATALVFTNSGNHYLQYNFAANKDSIQTVNFGPINVASYNYIHIDIYSPKATTFSLGLIDGDSVSNQFTLDCANPTLNKWVSYDIPLSLFSSNAVDLNSINAFLFIAGNTSNAVGTALLIDNIYFSTTANYYSNKAGNLDVLSTWGTNADGTNLGGIGNNAPSNFTSDNINYYVLNNPTSTIGSNWKVSGKNTKVIVGNLANPVNLKIPSVYTFIDSCVSGYVISPNSSDVTVNVTVSPSIKGDSIPVNFNGLSWDMNFIPTSYLSVPKLVNLIRNLGTGIMRIGAASADHMIWSNSNRGTYTGTDTLFKTDVDQYFNFANQIGWKTLFGLNLGTGTVAQATDEAKYISQNYSFLLHSYEIGNEPNLYYQGLRPPSWQPYTNYVSAFDSFYNSIDTVVTNLKVSGPSGDRAWVNYWGLPCIDSMHNSLTMATYHYYFGNLLGTNTISDLLGGDPALISNTTAFVNTSKKYQLPFRWSECNSIAKGGQDSVSNVFASALWGIDFMYMVAKLGCSGVNFHGQLINKYTPIMFTGGNVYPQPLYYGMLGFSLGSNGNFIQSTTSYSSAINCNVYTVLGKNGKYYITIVNKDLVNQAFLKITGLPPHLNTQLIRMNGSYIASKNCNLGNAITDAVGNWSNASTECAGADANSYQLKVPSGSAVVLIIN